MSFRAPPQAKVLNIFQEWHVGFHGTRASSVQPILNNGSLLMAGKDNFRCLYGNQLTQSGSWLDYNNFIDFCMQVYK